MMNTYSSSTTTPLGSNHGSFDNARFRDVGPLAPPPTPMARYLRDSTQNALVNLNVTRDSEESFQTTTSTTTTTTTDSSRSNSSSGNCEQIMAHEVKKAEVESKINSWQTAKVAKINNRFKREDAIISSWEKEQVHKATSWMKKVERKLEEKRAKAKEKMENEMAKAHKKAEERRASAKAKKGGKVIKVLEIAHNMRAIGRPPKCSLFS